MTSCDRSDNWKQFQSIGLPQKDESYNDLVFTDSLTGYLGGNSMIAIGKVNNQYQFIHRTVLYKTKDQGKSWLKIPLDYPGSVNRIFAFNDTVLVLLQDLLSDSVYILKSKNHGKNWEMLLSAPRNVYIREILFTNSDNGYIVTDDRRQSLLLKLQLNKKDTILNLPNNHYHYKIIRNKIFSLIPDQTAANSRGILIKDMETGEKKELLFDKPYYIASSTFYEKNLFLAASDNNTGKILRLTDNEITTYDLGKYSDYQPDRVFAYHNTIVAIVHHTKDVAFLGVIHHLLISKDNGQSWILEEIPAPMYLKPATMYMDQFFMTYCGTGSFQMRNMDDISLP